ALPEKRGVRNVALALVAPDKLMGPTSGVTLTTSQRSVTGSPSGSLAEPSSVTTTSSSTARSAPAFATGGLGSERGTIATRTVSVDGYGGSLLKSSTASSKVYVTGSNGATRMGARSDG